MSWTMEEVDQVKNLVLKRGVEESLSYFFLVCGLCSAELQADYDANRREILLLNMAERMLIEVFERIRKERQEIQAESRKG